MAETSPPTSRARRKDARPGEIRAAALALFAARGFAATRLDDIARAAGIGKGTIYLYYPTKEDLFRAVVRQDLLPDLDALEAEAAAHQGPAAMMLRRLLAAMVARIDADIAVVPKLILTEAGNFPALARFYAEEVAARGQRLVGAVLERGVARGEFRPIDVPAVVPVVIAPMLLLMLWRRSLGPYMPTPLDPAAVMAAALDLLLRGLAPEVA